jgi:hypothetical protein
VLSHLPAEAHWRLTVVLPNRKADQLILAIRVASIHRQRLPSRLNIIQPDHTRGRSGHIPGPGAPQVGQGSSQTTSVPCKGGRGTAAARAWVKTANWFVPCAVAPCRMILNIAFPYAVALDAAASTR